MARGVGVLGSSFSWLPEPSCGLFSLSKPLSIFRAASSSSSSGDSRSLSRSRSLSLSLTHVPLFIDGAPVPSTSTSHTPLLNPATQAQLGLVPEATPEEVARAVASSVRAYEGWRRVPVPTRARVMLSYQEVLRRNVEVLAGCITEEQGKTLEDARGDVVRGLEVVEAAAGIAPLLLGKYQEQVARGVDTYSVSQALGVVASLTPFNFPAMCPLWHVPLAVAAGNAVVLKPSERTPRTAVKLAELAAEAGFPEGVFNVVHGGKGVVEALVDHEEVKAVSFVGSSGVGRQVYARAAAGGKRVQCNLGAKNHLVVMPDADVEAVVGALVGAAFGAAGQRCMAVSVAVFVGGMGRAVREKLVARARGLVVGPGWEAGTQVGPLISKESKERVLRLVERARKEGAEVILDGRGVEVVGYERGNFVGPTIVAGVDTSMEVYREEVFGPVLCVVEVDTLDEALEVINANPNGNGTAIFTSSGYAAKEFQSRVEVGMVGVNVPIPVPSGAAGGFGFTGWNGSFSGDLAMYGAEGVKFFTRTKTVTAAWKEPGEGAGTLTGLGGVGVGR